MFRAEDADEARRLLGAAYRRTEPMVAAEKKARRRGGDAFAAVELGISNGRVESINKIKVTVKMGYGSRNADNLVSLLTLRCSDVRPQLPGRPPKKKEGGAESRMIPNLLPTQTTEGSIKLTLRSSFTTANSWG